MKHKKELYIFELNKNNSFKFDKSFDAEFPESKYMKSESSPINRVIKLLPQTFQHNNSLQINKLSQQQVRLLSLICQGYTTKMAAQEILIKPKTAEHYIERIKQKLDLHYKSELIHFYKNYISNFKR
jgi:DNA-binding NarL/FixJ family response regulator